jgi:hypothetical protein
MAENDGSDDPSAGQTVLLLRNPITGEKLQCRDEVVEWRELHEDLAEGRVADDYAAVGALIATTALFVPLIALHPIGALTLIEAETTADAIYSDLRSASGPELLEAGITLFKRQRYARAIPILELALGKDESLGIWDEGLLYLGLAYHETGNEARARTALSSFVAKSGVRDVEAYRKAENVLAELGEKGVPCESADPVELHW